MTINIPNIVAFSISLMTASGVFVHENKIDRATVTALAAPAVQAAYESPNASIKLATATLQGEAHTHVERASVGEAMRHLSTGMPKIQPRNDEKKHLLQNRVGKGHHPFDNYNLPILD